MTARTCRLDLYLGLLLATAACGSAEDAENGAPAAEGSASTAVDGSTGAGLTSTTTGSGASTTSGAGGLGGAGTSASGSESAATTSGSGGDTSASAASTSASTAAASSAAASSAAASSASASASASSGSGGGAATPLVIDISFTPDEGFSSDQYQWPNGSPNPPMWSDATLGMAGDGIKTWGGWVGTNHPKGDEITTASNRASGGGGRGLRHYKEYDAAQVSGEDNNGGGVQVNFVDTPGVGSKLREFWLQWWQRWPTGFTPVNVSQGATQTPAIGNGHWLYEKSVYISSGVTPGASVAGYGQGDVWHVQAVQSASGQIGVNLPGWVAQMGSVHGDGQWRRFQLHMKADSGSGAADGLIEAWIWQPGASSPTWQGSIAINWSGNNPSWPGWPHILLGSNSADVASNTPVDQMYTEFDDIKVSVAGFITQD